MKHPLALLLIAVALMSSSCAPQAVRRAVPTAVADTEAGPATEIAAEQTRRDDPWGNTDAMVLYMEAITLKVSGDLEGALGTAIRASEADPGSVALKILVAEIHAARRNVAEALSWAEAALLLDQESVEALRLIARFSSVGDDVQRAVDTYRRIIAVDPEDREAYLHLGGLLHERGRRDEAKEVFEEFLGIDPGNHIALLYLGRIHFEQGRHEEAARLLGQAVDRQPGLTSAWSLLGMAREELKDRTGAVEAYEKVLERDPHNMNVLRRLSALELDLGKGEAAEKHLKALIMRNPKDLSSRLSLGLHYSRVGEYAKALQEMRAARDLTTNNLGIDLSIADLLEELGEARQAEEQVADLLKRFPGEPEVVGRMASFHRLRKEYDTAISLLSGLLDGEADGPHLRAQISALGREGGKIAEAKDLVERSLAKYPEDPILLFELAVIHDNMKDFPATESALRRTIAAKGDHAAALNYLGYLYAERGVNLEESVELVKRALAVDPDNGYYLDSLGWAYYKLGRLPEARDELVKAIGQEPKDPTILDHLGDVLRDLGDIPAAVDYWRRSLQIESGRDEVKRKIEETLAKHPEAATAAPAPAQ